MEQNFYFNETCDPVDLSHCSQYYVDPCDCTQFYQCAQNQLRMIRQPCGPGTIYNHKTWVCDHPNDAICQTLRPWERCSVTESRMEQLRSMCFKSTSDSNSTGNSTPNSNYTGNSTPNSNNTGNSTPNSNSAGNSTPNSNNTGNSTPNSNNTGNSTPNSNNTGNSDQNTNGVSVPLITQTILPTVFGVLLPVIIIGLVIHRYRNRRFTKKDEIPTSNPDYCPYQTLQFNPIFGVDPVSSVEESDSTPNPLSMPQPYDADRPVPNLNSQEDEIASSGGSSYKCIRGSDTTAMSQPRDADQEFANKTVSSEDSVDRPVPDLNSREDEIASSGGSLYESIRGSDTTTMPQPSDADKEFANTTVSSEDSADRPVPNFNSQEDEIASSGGSSYESIRGSDTTSTPQPSDADQKFANETVSSEDSVDRPVPDLNSREDEIASSGGSLYESIRGSDTTTMPQPSDADKEFANTTVSSEDSADRPVPNFNSQEDEIVSSGGSSYESIRGSDTTSTPQPSDADQKFANETVSSEDSVDRPIPDLNSREDEIASSGGSSYESIRGSDTTAMPQPSDADKEFANTTVSSKDSADRPVPNFNSQEDEIASSGGSSYESIRGSDTTSTPQPSDADEEFANKTVSSEDSDDRPVPNLNSQEDEIASSGGNSYESIRGSDSTAMPQPRDADEEFANTTVSSEDSEYVVVQQSYPLFHPYISGNGPWPHKVIFSTKDHFLPPCTTFETT